MHEVAARILRQPKSKIVPQDWSECELNLLSEVAALLDLIGCAASRFEDRMKPRPNRAASHASGASRLRPNLRVPAHSPDAGGGPENDLCASIKPALE
jgi:hypothetical protein